MSRPFLPVIGSIGAAYIFGAVVLALVDPLALYSWGISAPLKADGDYSMELTPYLIEAAAKDPRFDTLVIGASTGHFYTPKMMQEIIPGTKQAFNLSYGRPSAADRDAVAALVLRYSHANHYIIEADWSYIIAQRDLLPADSFPLFLYDDKWWNDVRDMKYSVMKLTVAAMRDHMLWTPSWSKALEQETYIARYRVAHSSTFIGNYAAIIARHKGAVDAPSILTCEDMDSIRGSLIPFVTELSRRGAQVDLLVPPYSWIIYYRAGEPGDTFHRPTLLNDVLVMRKCVVQGVAGLPGVRIHAFDEPSMGGDFGKYMDVGHLYNAAASRDILRSIVEGTHLLNPDNIDAKNAQLRSNVVDYSLTSEATLSVEQ
jgi:hypothetical protein